MSERRIVSSDRASCPNCGGVEAIVRVRGNAFAATCTSCRESTIAPMLGARELLDAFGEVDEIAPVVSIMRASTPLGVHIAGELKRALDVELDRGLFGVELRLP